MKKIVVTIPMEEIHKEKIKNTAFNSEIFYMSELKNPEETIKDADIILGNVSPEILKKCEKLKWIHLNSAGANEYTKEGVLKEGTILTNSSGAYGLAIAEHMLAMVMALKKKICLYYENQKKHLWHDEGSVTSIYGTKTLVVGMGDIGGEFAKRMNALGSSVCGIRRNKYDKPEYIEKIYQISELDNIISEFDIVALSLPETKETVNLFNKERFSKMKKGAVLINAGRGTAVNTEDLCEALNSRKLGGACLDVTDIEPLPENSPLWNAENLLLTPHVSGGYHLNETLERIRNIAIENLKNYYEGKPLKNIVDFKTGYRKSVKQEN